MDIPGLYEGLWFFGGALIYNWLFSTFDAVSHKKTVKARLKAVESFLEMQTYVLLDLKFMLGIKYKILAESELLNGTEEVSRQLDDKMMREWASSSVSKLESVYPQLDRTAIKELEKYLYTVIETEE